MDGKVKERCEPQPRCQDPTFEVKRASLTTITARSGVVNQGTIPSSNSRCSRLVTYSLSSLLVYSL